ncbi:hypothetical protein NDA17_005390 [Ustilago hordei]|nr:hypothetical protein NDA17_005390 [Ustilago hordei]
MFSFPSSNRGKRRDDRLLPLTDFKVGPFKIRSSSNTPSSECEYTALTSSTETAVDIPLGDQHSSRRHSASSLDQFNDVPSPPPGYKPPSYYSTLLGATHRRAKSPSRRCKILTLAGIILPCLYIFCYITFRPPHYVVLPPERYVDVLRETLTQHIPSQQARDGLLAQLARIEHPDVSEAKHASAKPAEASTPYIPHSIVPPTIWSSDGKPAPAAWSTKWTQMGFEPKFLNDAGAENWDSDSLRQLLSQANVGLDAALYPQSGPLALPPHARGRWDLERHGHGPTHASHRLDQGRSASSPEPVRAIIGIENDPNENYDPRNFFERLRLLPMRRHRPLQFVQWTLHAAPNHPIMLDVLRRILRATDVYRAYEIEQQRDAHSDGWGWGDKSVEARKEQAKMREAHVSNPWDAVSMSWKWQAGHWRFGWDLLSIEEWTGPAVFTDAVVSYLYASAGVRPEDLSLLKKPVQIRDVVIVPSLGFNPTNHRKEGVSRLVHLFRGSWKG